MLQVQVPCHPCDKSSQRYSQVFKGQCSIASILLPNYLTFASTQISVRIDMSAKSPFSNSE